MDSIIGIFTALGVDSSVFTQFALVVILFWVLKLTLFGKLQEVLELRENKTTKLDSKANKKFAEADSLEEKYEQSLNDAYTEGHSILSAKKAEVTEKERANFKSAEEEINTQAEAKREVVAQELVAHKEKVMGNADSLSSDLINKLTN